MADVTENATGILRKRVFGVPVLYLAAGGAVILAVIAYRTRATPSEPEPVEEVAADEGDGDGYGNGALLAGSGSTSGYDAFVANGSVTQDPADRADPPEVPDETNDAWVRKGVDWLATQGVSGGAAQLALTKYVEGDQLSYTEGTYRDKVIRQFGAPPEYVKPGGTSAAPAAAAQRQGTPPTKHTVKGKNDDSYTDLCNLYYGKASADMFDLLQNANRGLPKAGPFRPGTVIVIPKYSAPKYYTSTKTTNTASEIARKNGTSVTALGILNDGMKFPVKAGTRVRVA